jgi:cytochrome c oxidase subunit 2
MTHARVTASRAAPARIGLVIVATVAAPVLLAGCSSNFGFPEPITSQGEDTLELWRIFFVIAMLVVALIWGLVAWSVVRYRRRSDAVPEQRQTMIKLEIFYTIVPLVLVGVLFALTLSVNNQLTALQSDPDLRVDVIGFQWQWQFEYPDDGVTVAGTPDEPAELVLPVGKTVRFNLEARDVIHSFWVPEFLEKRDLIPGIDNQIEVYVKEPGTWVGRCAEYCGLSHWQMSFTLRALPPAEFRQWLADAQALPQPIVPGAPEEAAAS